MARKSRKNINKAESITENPSKSLTGIYGRLSVEDNNYTAGDSLKNQVTFLKEFVERNEEDFQLINVYLDNGATGTNFDRNGWQGMMADIKAGKINCVVVKDFSRIGRNYIEVGNYLEKIFPFLNVRVVSVNDNFDSKEQPFESNLLMNSLTNIVNEYYARDISRKVLQAKKVMQDNGEYTSGVYSYGYMRSTENKRKMAVDPEVAFVVRKIFEWRVLGKGCSWIANYLNELIIPSPGLYRFMNGKQSFKKCRNSKWKAENVSSILTNPVYLGHTVQGKKKHSHFQNNGKSMRVPRADWIIAEDTHEPIIAQEQFDIAVHMAAESREKYENRMNAHADIPHRENSLRKKIYCGECGTRMFRRSKVVNGMRNYHYYCDARRRKLNTKCNQPYMQEELLMNCIRKTTEKQLQLLGKLQSKREQQKMQGEAVQKHHKQEDRKKYLEQEVLHIKNKRRELYEDMKVGMLSPVDFESEWEVLAKQRIQYEQEIQNFTENGMSETRANDTLGKYPAHVFELKADDIPSDLLGILIEKVTVLPLGHVEITYAYSDMVKETLAGKEGEGNESELCS